MKHQNILNFINFIRGVDERVTYSLVEPVREQIRLLDQYDLPGTFLVQYDALLMPEYQQLLKALDPSRYEIGLWYEIPKPLCEDCGIPWTSPLQWDYHCWCDFPVGYTREQREKLIDQAFDKFKEVFGCYPRSMGSWFFDSFTIRHIAEKYGLDALCNCKEQYGTDGYTLWGGYYGQGYYPARKNVFVPAQTKEQQIDIPVFRMLGSDPVYQYDFGMDADQGAANVQGVITLEPVYQTSGGGNPTWVDWYLKENYNGECLSFSYAQAGQENSFGWDAMKDGLTDQIAKIKMLSDAGKLCVETLGETGRRYQQAYDVTPASAITAHSAFDDPEKKSVWYCCKNYRVNLYADANGVRIRDIHLFDENDIDRYEDTLCTGNDATYDTLPMFDGNLYSGSGVIAGIYLQTPDGMPIHADTMRFSDLGNDCARVEFDSAGQTFAFTLTPDGITAESRMPYQLAVRIGRPEMLPQIKYEPDRLQFSAHDRTYQAVFQTGQYQDNLLLPENGVISVRLQTE